MMNNQSLNSEYNTRYDTVWNQINTEKQQQEAIRQYNQNYALQQQQLDEERRQAAIQQANWEKEYQLNLQKLHADQQAQKQYELTDNTQESANLTRLSDNGKELANKILFGLEGGQISNQQEAEKIYNMISNAYYNKQITENDAELVWNTFKLDNYFK